MRRRVVLSVVVSSALLVGCAVGHRELPAGEDPLADQRIRGVSRKVADWQLDHPRRDSTDWTNAVFYSGLLAAYRITDDPGYLEAVIEVGERNDWQLGSRYRHADDHALAQTYLEIFRIRADPSMFEAFQTAVERMMSEPGDWSKPHQPVDYWWADALFMSPPALAMLAEATADERYLELLDRLWLEAYGLLYDEDERLFHRDLRFRADSESRFWLRGNGWVLAGLARLLDALPEDRSSRAFYERVFGAMAERVAGLQGADGLWRSDLIARDPSQPGESSGSSLVCFALAWGVNRGLLAAEEFTPVVIAAWIGLYRNVDLEGRLGWVQKPGARPAPASGRDRDTYGSGAFLLAAEQVLALDDR